MNTAILKIIMNDEKFTKTTSGLVNFDFSRPFWDHICQPVNEDFYEILWVLLETNQILEGSDKKQR